MASPAVDFARNNQQRFLDELKDLLRIPSVSTLEEHKPDVQRAAAFVADELRRIGMEIKDIGEENLIQHRGIQNVMRGQ